VATCTETRNKILVRKPQWERLLGRQSWVGGCY